MSLFTKYNLERENHKNANDDGYTEYDDYGAPYAGTKLFAARFELLCLERFMEL